MDSHYWSRYQMNVIKESLYKMGIICMFSECGAGNFTVFPDPNSRECEPCPIGTHNDKNSSYSCTPCIDGWSTLEPGAVGY